VLVGVLMVVDAGMGVGVSDLVGETISLKAVLVVLREMMLDHAMVDICKEVILMESYGQGLVTATMGQVKIGSTMLQTFIAAMIAVPSMGKVTTITEGSIIAFLLEIQAIETILLGFLLEQMILRCCQMGYQQLRCCW
jgi:hypothetical protein